MFIRNHVIYVFTDGRVGHVISMHNLYMLGVSIILFTWVNGWWFHIRVFHDWASWLALYRPSLLGVLMPITGTCSCGIRKITKQGSWWLQPKIHVCLPSFACVEAQLNCKRVTLAELATECLFIQMMMPPISLQPLWTWIHCFIYESCPDHGGWLRQFAIARLFLWQNSCLIPQNANIFRIKSNCTELMLISSLKIAKTYNSTVSKVYICWVLLSICIIIMTLPDILVRSLGIRWDSPLLILAVSSLWLARVRSKDKSHDEEIRLRGVITSFWESKIISSKHVGKILYTFLVFCISL